MNLCNSPRKYCGSKKSHVKLGFGKVHNFYNDKFLISISGADQETDGNALREQSISLEKASTNKYK